MSTGNLPSLSEEAEGGVLSLCDKIEKNTLLDILHEKPPEQRKANYSLLRGVLERSMQNHS